MADKEKHMMPAKKLRVEQDANAPIEKKVLAKSIVELSKAAVELRNSGLNRRAVIVLLADSTGIGISACKRVLEGIEELRRNYCN